MVIRINHRLRESAIDQLNKDFDALLDETPDALSSTNSNATSDAGEKDNGYVSLSSESQTARTSKISEAADETD